MSARHSSLIASAAALAALAPAGIAAASDDPDDGHATPRLEGRAVLPAATYADGPPSGAALVPVGQSTVVINGIQFPTPSQPVEGFSAIVEGPQLGEYLAMADNGFGSKANSADFNIRAYVLRPDFQTARGGTGEVAVDSYIEFSDPHHVFPYRIKNETTADRVLTGADIDPESMQRGRDGTLWVGDEFGPWVLHFDAAGQLLEAPHDLPDDLWSPNHPAHPQPPAPTPGDNKVANSRGIEAMAMTPDGHWLYVVLEGAVAGDAPGSRRVYEFDTEDRAFTGRLRDHRVELGATGSDSNLVADAQALDRWHLLLIERDGGRGLAATYRSVWEVTLRDVAADGYLPKTLALDMTAIPDPNLVSLPAARPEDVGLGDPFRVTCESIEALHVVSTHRLLLGCDNNFPNEGRTAPVKIADDNEFITVRIP
jgi:hypothetical protein